MISFNLLINDIECRPVPNSNENKYEVVRWEGKLHCYVVAHLDPGKEGYDIRSVGNRFFTDDVNWNTLGRVMKISVEVLDTLLAEEYVSQAS